MDNNFIEDYYEFKCFPDRKVLIRIIIVVFFSIIFFPLVIHLVNIILVKNVLSYVPVNNNIIDVIYLVFFIGCYRYIGFRYVDENYAKQSLTIQKPSNNEIIKIQSKYFYWFTFYLIALSYYVFIRFSGSYFYLNPIFGSSIYYLDFLFFTSIVFIAAYIINLSKLSKHKPTKSESNILLEDVPISSENEDELDGLFGSSSDKITNIILSNNFQRAFTIGLSGEWGDGKSSVFNLSKKKLESESNIKVIEFSPWIGFDKKILVKDFFDSIAEHIDFSISSSLNQYANQIVEIEYNNDIIRFFKSIFYKEMSLEKRFEELNNRIKLLDKKVVVFIDDVDRLDKEEIFEVLKLIRKTANFYNFYFVIAYDRDYVNKSIADFNTSINSRYLDKIINVEINLPYFDVYILKKYFITELQKALNLDDKRVQEFIEYDVSEYEKNITEEDFYKKDLFVYWLSNFRDIKKMINSIATYYNKMSMEINLHDLVLIEILKLKHPYLYRLLISKSHELFKINEKEKFYYLTPINDIDAFLYTDSLDKAIRKSFAKEMGEKHPENMSKARDFLEVKTNTIFEFYLSVYLGKGIDSKIEKERIKELINRLFPNDSDGVNMDKNAPEYEHSIHFINQFEKYFAGRLAKNHIPSEEFLELLNLKKEQLYSKIDKWQEEGKQQELMIKLRNQNNFLTKMNLTNVVLGLLYLLDKDIAKIDAEMIMIDVRNKMSNTSKYKSLFANDSYVNSFYLRLFKDLKFSHIYVSRIFKKEKWKGKTPIDKISINIIRKRYIEVNLVENKFFNDDFFILLDDLITEFDKKETTDKRISDLILQKLKSIDNLELLLQQLIIPDRNDWGGEPQYTLNGSKIKFMFGSYDNFTMYLDSQKHIESPILHEFLDFYKKFKNNNYTSAGFNFDKVKVQEP